LNLREISSKIKNINNILQVFTAMKMMSSSKYQVFLKNLKKIETLQENLPFFPEEKKTPSQNDAVYLVYASDKGLCGNFNTKLKQKMKELQEDAKIILLGKKLLPFLRERKIKPLMVFQDVDHYNLYDFACFLSEQVYELPLSSFNLLYIKYFNGMKQEAVVENLFELGKMNAKNLGESPSEGDFKKVSKELFVTAKIYHALMQSKTCEHFFRMQAMENSINNSKEMKESLNLIYNKQRQSKITQEILEIINGSLLT